MSASAALRLERWGRTHGVVMSASAAIAAGVRRPELLGLAALLSLLALIVHARRDWTPRSRFGSANVVTSLRVLATLVALFAGQRWGAHTLALLAVGILLLDVADGALARRLGLAGAFGALYDVEADALLVMTLAISLWLRDIAGGWVLLAGFWRYLYLATPVLLPTEEPPAKRSRLGRAIYVFMIAAFASAFVLPQRLGATLCALATAAVSLSFARSFWQRYRPQRV